MFARIKNTQYELRCSWLIILLLALTVALVSFPLLFPLENLDDLAFHLSRIQSIAENIQSRSAGSPFYFYPAMGYGYAAPLCYPDLFLYLPAFLVCLGMKLTWAYKTFVLVVHVATVLIAYFSFKQIFNSQKIGVVGALLWVTIPVRLFDIYFRAAVGEYLAMTFFPLIALGVFLIFSKQKSARYGWIAFSIGVSCVVYAHVLSVVLLLFSAPFVLVAGFFYNHSSRVLKEIGLSTLLIVLLTAAFVVPFLTFLSSETLKGSVPYAQAIHDISQTGLSFSQLSACTPALNTQQYNFQTQPPLGWGVLLAAGISIVLTIYKRDKKSSRWTVLLLAAGALFALIATEYWPWFLGNEIPEGTLNPLGILAQAQFSSRFLSLACFFIILAVCAALLAWKPQKTVAKTGVLLALGLICVLETAASMPLYLKTQEFFQASGQTKYSFPLPAAECKTPQDVRDSWNAIMGAEYVSGSAYAPEELDGRIATTGSASASSFTRETPTTFSVYVDGGDAGGTVRLPVLYYKRCQIVSTDTPSVELKKNENNVDMELIVPANVQSVVHIAFVQPALWTVARWISFLTLAVLVAWGIHACKQRANRKRIFAPQA